LVRRLYLKRPEQGREAWEPNLLESNIWKIQKRENLWEENFRGGAMKD